MNETADEPTVFLEQSAYRIGSDDLEVTVVPALGSRVISLRSRKTGTETLRMPASFEEYESTPMLYGIPVLFPPNRIEDGKFSFQGRTYRFEINEPRRNNHIHGLVHNAEWKFAGIQAEDGKPVLTTGFDSRDHPAVFRHFPHHFRIVMRFFLENASLIQKAEIFNDSDTAFPWGIGYHTAFRFPFGENSKPRDCILSAPAGDRWELNDRMMPSGKLVKDARSDSLRQGITMDGVSLDDLFLVDSHGGNSTVLTDLAAGLRVTYEADEQFTQWVLHNGDGKSGYLCPEPYTCVTNAFNLPLDCYPTGLQVLEPGQSKTVTCKISVEVRRLQQDYYKATEKPGT